MKARMSPTMVVTRRDRDGERRSMMVTARRRAK
jgi:hypothetical protein